MGFLINFFLFLNLHDKWDLTSLPSVLYLGVHVCFCPINGSVDVSGL